MSENAVTKFVWISRDLLEAAQLIDSQGPETLCTVIAKWLLSFH